MKKTSCDELASYAVLDGTEWGEAIMALCHLSYYSHLLSESLAKEISTEIKEQLVYVEAHASIVEETKTHTSTFKSLEWNE